MVPVRLMEWEGEEKVVVKVPRFRTKVGKKFCDSLKKEPTYNVNLDEHGSEAWKLIDGKRTVRAIGLALREKFGEELEPIFERVGTLFNIFEANQLITYKKKNNDSYDEGEIDHGHD